MSTKRMVSAALALALFAPAIARAQDDEVFEDLDIPAEESDPGENFDEFSDEDGGESASEEAEGEPPADDEALGEEELAGDELGDDLDSELEDGLDDESLADGDLPEDDLGEDLGDELAEEPIEEEPAELGDALGDAEGQQGTPKGGLPGALLESSNEVFDPNDPSYQFARVPLLPPMSDENWRKWAGPAQDKIYDIRRGDTLWAVSERLFGTPFLWPKVWQLNANLNNPHIIEPKLELQFKPGNPNSAPALALRTESQLIDIPLTITTQKLGTLEQIEVFLKRLLNSPDPPFKKFLADDAPEELAEMPERNENDHIFYSQGDMFKIDDLADGEYNIVRVIKPIGNREMRRSYGSTRLNWVGRIVVSGGRGMITDAYEAIEVGDPIVSSAFDIPALALQEVEIGDDEDEMEYVPLDEGAFLGASQYRVFGVRLSDSEVAPPGSLLTIEDKGFKVGTGLVVYRDGRYATVWVAESTKEINAKQRLR